VNRSLSIVRFQALRSTLILIGLLSLSALAQAEQFGNMRFEIPQGWKTQQRGTVLFLIPPNLSSGQAALVAISPSLELKDFQAQFNAVVQKLQAGRTVVKTSDQTTSQSPDGYSVLRREMIVREKDGSSLYLFVTAANPNDRFESLYYATNDPDLYLRYAPQLEQLVNSIKFVAPAETRPAPPAVSVQPSAPSKPSTPPAPSATPPTYVDEKSRSTGEANLKPPLPGRTRLEGLYATQDTSGHVGPGGAFYQDVIWRFYYFMPNGYVYLGPKNAGLEALRCTKPTVNQYGDPVCTTYTADNGQLRIGLRNPARLRRKGNDLVIGDYEYALVPKVNNLRLSGYYEYYSAGVAAADSSGISFYKNGRFKSSSFVGVAVDTNPNGTQPSGGNRVTVSGSSSSSAEGSYRINGYTLELSYSDGRKSRSFFAQVGGELVVRIGERVYTRKGAP
jgi:hypothetical protein